MKHFYALIFLLLTKSGFAQYKDRPAQLVTRNQDTLSGLVRDYDWHKNPSSVTFIHKQSRTETVPVNAIEKLAITNGPVYEGLFLTVPYYVKSPLRTGANPYVRVDSSYYLSELLLDSDPVKLYRCFDDEGTVRFILAKNDSLHVLHDIHLSLLRGESLYSYADPAYRKQLSQLLYECPTLATGSVMYDEQSLINLLNQYVSYCRVGTKIYREQKEIRKPIVSLGGHVASWRSSVGPAVGYGLSAQLLLPRRFYNIFVLFDLGEVRRKNDSEHEKALQIGIYGGRYFGSRAVQLKLYTGLSTVFGFLDTGLGVSYRKTVSLEARYPVLTGVIDGFREGNQFYIRPMYALRITVPLKPIR